MAEKRTEVIRHKVLNEETGEVDIVEKEFVYNESPDGSVKYITYEWCVDRAKESNYATNPTFATSFRKREEKYMYEDEQGNTTPIIAVRGEFKDEHTYVYDFTTEDENDFEVVIVL